jgi:BirA family biotin operon repressor/biotin-[acetyl-CoA-carboxylase] ligase
MDSARPGERARWKLASTRFGRLDWVAETGSTNTDLLARAAAGEPEGAVLVADHQSAGKGTRGRNWVDTPGSQLMVSALLRPALPPTRLGRLTMAWSVAAAQACCDVAGVEVRLKWPNDVSDEAGQRKVAGVLAESQVGSDGRVDALVIGMGMNVNGGVPAGLAVPGVSLAELAGRPVDREDLLISLLGHFDGLYDQADTPVLLERYRDCSATLGRLVQVELPSGVTIARAHDVTEEGHLVVEVDGRRVPLAAADVIHLRPASPA